MMKIMRSPMSNFSGRLQGQKDSCKELVKVFTMTLTTSSMKSA
eukprot:CAMPEP_0116871104 /NCGR_PEP_ID=MMETSP0463-20121206/1323_1 /TAXON_ID=181622 /ORGANISM="Strombidinopsis sp, Strain SopsisLIS2011" /LENGTH=42 /DNA_ID= /DNA_START= /DNA_END= /DNA_ORIENTATION=